MLWCKPFLDTDRRKTRRYGETVTRGTGDTATKLSISQVEL